MSSSFGGVPVVSQDAARAMDKVGTTNRAGMDAFGQAALDKLKQRRPMMHLNRVPSMNRQSMVEAGFSVASASHKAASGASGSAISRLSKSVRLSMRSLLRSAPREFDISTPFGRIEQAISRSMRLPDDEQLASEMCKTVGDVLLEHPEVDVKVSVRLKSDIYIAIVDAVMAAYVNHIKSPEMQRWGTYAIWRVALANPGHAQYMMSLGAADAIRAAKDEVIINGETFDDRALAALADAPMAA